MGTARHKFDQTFSITNLSAIVLVVKYYNSKVVSDLLFAVRPSIIVNLILRVSGHFNKAIVVLSIYLLWRVSAGLPFSDCKQVVVSDLLQNIGSDRKIFPCKFWLDVS